MSRLFSPNYTQVPNVLLDNIGEFSEAEFKVLLLICRQTFGWQREKAVLSISFLAKGTGLSESGISKTTASLIQKGWIQRHENAGPRGANAYQLVILDLPTTWGGEGSDLPTRKGSQMSDLPTTWGGEGSDLPTTWRQRKKRPKERKIADGSASAEAENAEHTQLIETWCETFEIQFGRKYAFQGGKDAKSVKRLLAFGGSPKEVMRVATAAWSRPNLFNCKQAISLTGLASRWNEIRQEIEQKTAGGVVLSGAQAAKTSSIAAELEALDIPVQPSAAVTVS